MTSPYASLPRPPEVHEDLAAFYPEWGEPASGYGKERALYERLAADIARTRRARRRQILFLRLRRAWQAVAGRRASAARAASLSASPASR